jgi:hypothetical protein
MSVKVKNVLFYGVAKSELVSCRWIFGSEAKLMGRFGSHTVYSLTPYVGIQMPCCSI